MKRCKRGGGGENFVGYVNCKRMIRADEGGS